jgi:hypothetical protein
MLVVDTVGLDKRTWVDGFGTPHTDKLHVVERYHLRNPDTLEVLFTAEDPGAFTMPWSAIATYRKDRSTSKPYTEVVCAENNRMRARAGCIQSRSRKRPTFDPPHRR